MALREFEDENGATWVAWDVPPYRIYEPARAGTDRRTAPDPTHQPERRSGRDRRRRTPMPGMESGWVCFQGGGEKRRLAPPPPGWDACPEQALRELWRRSTPYQGVPRTR